MTYSGNFRYRMQASFPFGTLTRTVYANTDEQAVSKMAKIVAQALSSGSLTPDSITIKFKEQVRINYGRT